MIYVSRSLIFAFNPKLYLLIISHQFPSSPTDINSPAKSSLKTFFILSDDISKKFILVYSVNNVSKYTLFDDQYGYFNISNIRL